MSSTSYSQIPRLSFLFIISLSALAAYAAGQCVGILSYKIKIAMNWTTANGEDRVKAIFAVAHTPNFKLFDVGKPLDTATAEFVRNQKSQSLLQKLRAESEGNSKKVVQFDKVENVQPDENVSLTIQVHGRSNATLVSFIGLVRPDSFFGKADIEMCNGTQFLRKLPEKPGLLWAESFKGGTIAPQNGFQAADVSAPNAVSEDTGMRYATFTMTEGGFRFTPQRWKIYIVAGCVAAGAVIAVTSLSVVNHIKKKSVAANQPVNP